MLTINGNTEEWQEGSLSIADELNSRNTASFTIITANTITVGQDVIITDGALTIFAGTIDYYEQEWLRGSDTGNRKQYSIQCIDYNQLLDKGTKLAVTYVNETIADIIADTSNERAIGSILASEGITIGTISGGTTVIRQAVFNYIAVSDALNYIKDLTGLNWNVDYSKELTLFYRSDNTGVMDQTEFLDIRKRVSRQEYRNSQLVRGGKGRITIPAPEKPTPKPDGVSREFFTRFPIAEQPLLYVDAVQVTPSDIGINGLDQNKKWYWTYNSNKITHDPNETVLADTKVLTVTYIGLQNIVALTQNPSGIANRLAIETGSSGIYEEVEQRKELDTKEAVLDFANGLLTKYMDIPERVYVTTREYLPSGLIVNLSESKVDISGQYLIESMGISELTSGQYVYSYVLASGESLGSWVEFFRKLVNTGQDFSIQGDEVLVFVIVTSENILLLEDSITATITTSLTPSDTLYDISTLDDYFTTGYSEVII